MRRKIIFLISGLLLSILSFATTWNFIGGLDGESGLMIVYKTLPPLLITIENPETMIIPRGSESFRYSEVAKSKRPINVKIEVQFNNAIVENNGVNKEIVRTIYDNVNIKFLNDGIFSLNKVSNMSLSKGEGEIVIKNANYPEISAEALFTDINGVLVNGTGKGTINKTLGNTIKNGLLQRSDIYIDAIFNKDNKELVSGQYEGKVTLEFEFLGKGGQ